MRRKFYLNRDGVILFSVIIKFFKCCCCIHTYVHIVLFVLQFKQKMYFANINSSKNHSTSLPTSMHMEFPLYVFLRCLKEHKVANQTYNEKICKISYL